jgi:hypothetical protein
MPFADQVDCEPPDCAGYQHEQDFLHDVALWLDKETAEITALLLHGVIAPFAEALTAIVRQNKAELTRLTNIVSQTFTTLVESNTEALQPIMALVRQMTEPAIQDQQSTSLSIVANQIVGGINVGSIGYPGIQQERQTGVETVPSGLAEAGERRKEDGYISGTTLAQAYTAGYSAGRQSIGQADNRSAVLRVTAGPASQAGTFLVERGSAETLTEEGTTSDGRIATVSTSLSTVLSSVSLLREKEGEQLASQTDTPSRQQLLQSQPQLPQGETNTPTHGPSTWLIYYAGTMKPNVVVLADTESQSISTLETEGYTLISSYPTSAGWTQSTVIDQSRKDVDIYLESLSTLSKGDGQATSVLGSEPFASRQIPVDWWTQGTDWTLGPWDKKVRRDAARYYGPQFAAAQSAGSLAEAYATVIGNLVSHGTVDTIDVFGQQPPASTPGGGSTPPLFGD